jgi:hypothetical protein
VSKVNTLFSAERRPLSPQLEQRWPFLLGCGSLVGLFLVLVGERARQRPKPWRALLLFCMTLYGLVGGLLGALLIYLSLWSDHAVAHGNINVLLLNPLTLLAGALSAVELAAGTVFVQRVADALWFVTCASSLTLLALKLAPVHFEQDVSLTASLLIPISVGIALARLRSPDPQGAASAAWVAQRS